MKRPTLRQANNILSLVVIGLCVYVIAAPFWPQVTVRVASPPPLVQAEEEDTPPPAPPAENTLVIPRINLQQTIYEGGKWVLSKGIWHPGNTGNPASGGNMVMSGHRFTYGGPAVLYHLDKVQVGDEIVIYWQQQKHTYLVKEVLVVPPTNTTALAATTDARLTIYTCTPLITAKNRLIVIAQPTENTP
jgi:sortase A